MIKFFALTYAITWLSWFGAAVIGQGPAPAPPMLAALHTVVFLIGVFAPALVALALTARDHGRAAAAALLNRIFAWQVPARWYVFAAGYFVAIKLAVALVYRVATGAWPHFGTEAWYVMAGAILISTWAQAGEEIGWRGYALPRLAARFGLGAASIVLGVLWACWHLPLFFTPSTSTFGQSFPVYLLQVTAISVAMAWLYWQTNGSLLLVMLLHAAVNNTKDIVPSAVSHGTTVFTLRTSLAAWLTTTLLWLCASYFLYALRDVRIARELPRTNDEDQHQRQALPVR